MNRAKLYILGLLTAFLICMGYYYDQQKNQLDILNETLKSEVSKNLRNVNLHDGSFHLSERGFYYKYDSMELGLNVFPCGKPLASARILVEHGKLSELHSDLKMMEMVSKDDAVNCLSEYMRQADVKSVNDRIQAYEDEKKSSTKIENSWGH